MRMRAGPSFSAKAALRLVKLAQGIRLAACSSSKAPRPSMDPPTDKMACHERAQRVEWRRRESNPRPEITEMAASTCLVGFLISTAAAKADILRRGPVVFVSPLDQRPNQ